MDTMGDPHDSPTAGEDDMSPASDSLNRVSPLPWTWRPAEYEDDYCIGGASLRDASGERSVFTEDCGDFQGLSSGNARYIVTACNMFPELVSGISAFLAKWDAADSHLSNPLTLEQLRSGQPYTGPNLVPELNALRALLAKVEAAK